MKDKNGFTLVELLAVIAILAILVIIALPNVMGMFNDAKKNSFTTELKQIYKVAQQTYINDSMFDQSEQVYARCNASKCEKELQLSGRTQLEYYIKIDKGGKVVEYHATDGTYQYSYKGNDLLITDIGKDNDIKQISQLDEENIISINCNGQSEHVSNPTSFSSDSWSTIANAVRSGNISAYHVGDTKEVDLGEYGVHNVRITNTSSPSECSSDNFSQTACGFVIEFEDIIIKKKMNEERINNNGWCASNLRTFINNDIYNALPADLKNVITETKVISGYLDGETALTCSTNDKLYLLSSKELNGTLPTFGSSGNYVEYGVNVLNTRQLDYYKSNTKIKKLDGSAGNWWVRSVVKRVVPDNRHFSVVTSAGKFYGTFANTDFGVSPAFRIN